MPQKIPHSGQMPLKSEKNIQFFPTCGIDRINDSLSDLMRKRITKENGIGQQFIYRSVTDFPLFAD